MSAALDQLLARSARLANVGVLFVANGHSVLLMHPADAGDIGTWQLPSMDDVEPAVYLDAPEPFGAVLLSRCEAEFETVPSNKYDQSNWASCAFALTCSALDPAAAAAIKQFTLQKGENQMVSPRSFIDAQQKADRVARAFGDVAGAPAPLNGETETDYRIRLLSRYKEHSKAYQDANLPRIAIADASVFGAIEDAIYTDALAEATRPTKYKPGELRGIATADASGRLITRYYGDPNACWDRHNAGVRYVTRFCTPGAR